MEVVILATVVGFLSGMLGSFVYQTCQRHADKKRWEIIKNQN